MAALKDFIYAFINLKDIKEYFKLFMEILPSPTEKTMHIVDYGHSVNPFKFMAFCYSIYALIIITEPLFSGKLSFANSIVQVILFLITYLVFAAVQYKILKDVSHSQRTFDNYLVMSAIMGGIVYLLFGSAFIVILFSEPFGGLLFLAAMAYIIPYGIKTSKQFWQISYGKIILYSFLSSIAAIIAFTIIVVILVFGLGMTNFFGKTEIKYGSICETPYGNCNLQQPGIVGSQCSCYNYMTGTYIEGIIKEF
jgi:hypothetical protein